jgi:predicted transcriptional regulator
MAKETVGKYSYDNRIKVTVPPAIKEKVISQADATGASQSSIVAEALKEYYQRRQQPATQSKHSY